MASIKSFQRQTFKNKELVVVYSESNDNSMYFLQSLDDKNIKLFKYNGSIYKSLNFGIQKAKGDIIGILHSDDIFFNEFVLEKISLKFKKKYTDIVFGNILYSEKNNLLKLKRIWNNININNDFEIPPHTSTFIKRDICKKNKYKTNYKISSDTNYLLNLKKKNYIFSYINENITIMRYGGLSTKIDYFFIKAFEDIKIFKKNNLSFFSYLKKILIKTNQIVYVKNLRPSKYHHEINNIPKIKFFNLDKLDNYHGKVVSALNLAFLTYNEKYKLRTHKYEFWPDGIFSKFVSNKNKLAGRFFIKKIISKLNKKKIFKKIYILGSLNVHTKEWINSNLKRKCIYMNLPYGHVDKILKKTNYLKLYRKSIIILTLPTPKQEIVANQILNKFPDCLIICIGGSLNILSGVEKQVPKILNNLYLEWLWRLKFDTKRRLARLIESIFIFIKILVLRRINLF